MNNNFTLKTINKILVPISLMLLIQLLSFHVCYAQSSQDCDGDGILNIFDLDDDNDGVPDTEEAVCYNSSTQILNTVPYPYNDYFNTSSTQSPVNVNNLFNNSLNVKYSLIGDAIWQSASGTAPSNGGGLQIKNNGGPGVGDYLYFQPIATNTSSLTGANTNNYAEYELSFPGSVSNPSYVSAGLNNEDVFEVYAFNGTTPIPLDASNLTNFSPAILPSNWEVYDLGDGMKVVGKSTAGGTSVTTNIFTTTIPGVVTKIVIRSYKNITGSTSGTGTVTTGITTLAICDSLADFDNDGLPNTCDLDSDGDGCSDAFESGATTSSAANFVFPGPVNAQGQPNVPAYVSTYSTNSLDTSIKNCVLLPVSVPTPNPDVNQTWVDVPVTGDVYTNDEVPSGSTYANPSPNPSNPGSALPSINPDGTYTFTSPIPGVFTFQVPVSYPGGGTQLVDLVITVLDDSPTADNAPVANVDLAITPLNTAVTLNTLWNDSPGDATSPLVPGSVTVSTAPSNGTTSVNPATGQITYTPNAGFSGQDTLTYFVVDADGDTAYAKQIITILPIGSPNTTSATDDYKTTPFNTPVSGNAITNDMDAEGDIQTIVPQTTTIAGKGTLVLNANGTYTFTPVDGFVGPVEFPYSIYDNNVNVDSAMATIHILVEPPVPTPNPDVNQTWVDVPVTGDVYTNDEVPSGSTYANPSPNPSNPGSALPSINPDGTYTFTSPIPGVFTFQVPVSYPGGGTQLVDLVITVLDDSPTADNAPVANVDLAITPLNTAVTLNTLWNDSPGDATSPLVPGSVTVSTAPSNGTTSVNPATGQITYTPNAGFSGQDTLTYLVVDADGDTAYAKQIITILPIGSPNTTSATDDYKTTPFNTPVSGNAITNDMDAEGDTQTIVPQTTTIAGKGTLVLNANGTYTFTPVDGFVGPVEFPYSIYDNNVNVDSAMATIHILVEPPVTAPNPDVNQTWVDVPVTGDVHTNDEVPSGSTYANPSPNPSNPGSALPSINPDGTYTFTSPIPGVFTFQVPVSYPGGGTQLVDLVITVLDDSPTADNAPVANVDLAITPLNTAVTLNTLWNDHPGDATSPLVPGSVTVSTAPSNGTTSVNPATGQITYTPNAGFSGQDTLTYLVVDADGDTAYAKQIITILPIGSPNTTSATDDYKTTPFNTPVSGNAITNDMDAEGDTQTIVPQTTTIAGKGTLVLNANGTYTFTPVDGFVGPVEFPYSIYDNNVNVDSAMATIHILVEPPVNAPNPDVNVTWVNIPVTGDVSTNDANLPQGTTYANPLGNNTNPDGGANLPSINPDGTYTFVSPVPGVYTWLVPMKACVTCDSILVELKITVLNSSLNTNPPAANTDIAITPKNTPVTLNTLSNDYTSNTGVGVGLNPTSVTVIDPPSNGTTSINPSTGEITYTPNQGFVGVDTLTYSVLDSLGNTVTALQIITIIDTTNTANTTSATDDYRAVTSGTPVTGNAMENDNDAEGNSQKITPQTTTIPGKGTLDLDSTGAYTFTPISGFTGPVNFPYETTDNLGAVANATIYFIVKGSGFVFPVTLTSFYAIGNGCNVNLHWSTSAEKNTGYFSVLRKASKENGFFEIGQVNAVGNSTTESKYSFTDKQVESGSYEYRLKVVDIDMHATMTNIKTAEVNCSKIENDMLVYPNPTNGNLNITMYGLSNAEEDYLIKVIDFTGKTILERTITMQANSVQTVSLDLLNYATGIYNVTITNSIAVKSFKVMKSK